MVSYSRVLPGHGKRLSPGRRIRLPDILEIVNNIIPIVHDHLCTVQMPCGGFWPSWLIVVKYYKPSRPDGGAENKDEQPCNFLVAIPVSLSCSATKICRVRT